MFESAMTDNIEEMSIELNAFAAESRKARSLKRTLGTRVAAAYLRNRDYAIDEDMLRILTA